MSDVLTQPLALPSGEILPNRLAKAAMTEGLADPRGRATEGLQRLYARWAAGGVGLLISGNVAIDRDHLERPGNVIIDGRPDADALAALRAWTRAARAHGAGFWMQLSHAGRQTFRAVNPAPKAPSAVAVRLPGRQFGAPVALREDEILALVERFAAAAVVAREAGCSGVELHAAHGYLLSQFLSPRANQRRDAWGGSLENRARLLLAIVARTRAAVGRDFTLAVKLNSADFQRGGFDAGDSLEVTGWLAAAGIDVLEISGGTYEQPRMMAIDGIEAPYMPAASTVAREGYFVGFAQQIQGRITVPLMVTGGFRSAAAMAHAVEAQHVAIVGLGRPLCTDPEGPRRLLDGGAELDRPEARLRVGPGWFGPASPVGFLRALNGFGVIFWFYQQLRAIARSGATDPSLGVLTALRRERADQAAWLRAARGVRRTG